MVSVQDKTRTQTQNPFADKIKLDLGTDEDHYLYYDLNAFVEIEERTGRSLIKGDLFNLNSAKEVRLLLYAGLMHEDENLTPHDVGKLINMGNISKIAEAIQAAITGAVPSSPSGAEWDGEGADDQGNAQTNGNGLKSGQGQKRPLELAKRTSGR